MEKSRGPDGRFVRVLGGLGEVVLSVHQSICNNLKGGGEEEMGKMRDELTEFPINFTRKAELGAYLRSQVADRRFITPLVLLCQLQFGTVDHLRLVKTIMNFDTRAIRKALNALAEQGLT